HLPFTTNEDLFASLKRLSREHNIVALLHVSALADFRVKSIEDIHGQRQDSAKIDSRGDGLVLRLEPARKIISSLRELFPTAVLVGWKYELAGTRAQALSNAWRQLRENHTDACMLNGKAWGSGFAFCTPPDSVIELSDKAAVVQFLPNWLAAKAVRM